MHSFCSIYCDRKLLEKLKQKLLHLCVLNFMHVIDLKIQNNPELRTTSDRFAMSFGTSLWLLQTASVFPDPIKYPLILANLKVRSV